MTCPRRSRGGGRRDILHTRSLSRPSSGNWRWAFFVTTDKKFLPQTKSFHLRQKVFTSDKSFHLRQKVFTSDKKFSPQTKKFSPQTKSFHLRQKFSPQTKSFHLRCMYKVFFSAGSPFSILKWKKANQPSSGSNRWNFLEYQLWLTLVSFLFVTESGEGQ